MNEKVEDPSDDRNYNCTVVINSDGEIVSTYHKTHLYDAFGYKESDDNKPGDHFFEPIDTPFGKIGLFVCYEVPFPGKLRVISVPRELILSSCRQHGYRDR